MRRRTKKSAEPVAEAAAPSPPTLRGVGETAPAARGGIPAALARIFGRRRSPTQPPEESLAVADDQEIRALRDELERELERVAGEDGPRGGSEDPSMEREDPGPGSDEDRPKSS